MDLNSFIKHIIVNYRWVFVLAFLLPLSLLYDIYNYGRSRLVFWLNSAPGQHNKKVQRVQQQVLQWRDGDQRTHMCTARPGWQTISFRQSKYKATFTKVEVNMIDVLEVDVKRQIVRCEPLVSMGQLTATLLPLGWTLPVVPEMDDLTVGGLVMGTGIETSSHKAGLFQHICVSFELVIADGSVVICSQDEHADLFYSVPWSYGTLGFLTAVEIRIIPAKKFVRLEYRPCRDRDQLLEELQAAVRMDGGNDFVEAICYSQLSSVVMTGTMVDDAPSYKINNVSAWYKPWFFRHVASFLHIGQAVEYLPLRDYYHRHTRAIFWELQDIIPFGNNVLFRLLFGWMVPPKVSLLKLTQGQAVKELYENNHIIQDMLVPLDALDKALNCFHKEVKVYPLWLCPFRLPVRPGMLRTDETKDGSGGAALYVDIGVYGVPGVDNFHPVHTTRRLETFVRSVNGFQMLYADCYLTRAEFRSMFDHRMYDALRRRYSGTLAAFPEVYDKVCRSARD